jgi:KUP system potassium uptake protein
MEGGSIDAGSDARPAARLDSDGAEHGPPDRMLALAALGVVYGDIGTSPLYAFKQCFHAPQALPPTAENVLGVLSLIVWSLFLVVSVKYLAFILRADNRGEGGIVALVALLNPWRSPPGTRRHALMMMGLFGAALLYGDGTITPAISVLSAVEGVEVATPTLGRYVVPVAAVILFGLFALQNRGTSWIGSFFGPVMLLWFVVLGALGAASLIQAPAVLEALDPGYGVRFLVENKLIGFIALGTIFLTVTGAEALYADMGHFGRQPIRLAWFTVALPALLLNYFGQGALVLADPGALPKPFYGLAPHWALYPIVILATAATVIASQAVISGAFSLTRQAVQLNLLPRMRIVQTDSQHIGQIYIPAINWLLMIATISLVLSFRTSNRLGAAYGLAVSAQMVITTVLAPFVAVRWGWSPIAAAVLAAMFLIIDLAFFGANLFKILDGGWYPLLVAIVVFTVMGIWRYGLKRFAALTGENRSPLDEFLTEFPGLEPRRVPGTAVFMTSNPSETPLLLLHHIEHNQALHARVVLVTVVTEDAPRVPTAERLNVEKLPHGFYRVVVHYGFMQSPNIPVALRLCERFGLDIDPGLATYYLGHEEVVPTRRGSRWALWRAQVFAFLWRNATRATAFYKIPPEHVIMIGLQVEL